MARYWPLLLSAWCLTALLACRNTPDSNGVARFNAAFDAVAASRPPSTNSAEFSGRLLPIWNSLDALILEQLNAGASHDDIAALVSQLHTDRPVVAPYAVFLSSEAIVSIAAKGRLPQYYLTPLEVAGEQVLLANYTYLSGAWGSSSRLSVLSNKRGHWTRTDAQDFDSLLEVYPFPGRPTSVFVTMEVVVHVDGGGGYLQGWSVSDGRLARVGARLGELEDAGVSRDGDALAISYASFPSCLGPNIQVSHDNIYKLTLHLAGGQLTAATTSVAPWFDVLERLCDAVEKQDIRTVKQLSGRAIVPDQLGPRLWNKILEASGDVARGEGYVAVLNSEGTFRIVSRRHPNGEWMVDEVVRVSR